MIGKYPAATHLLGQNAIWGCSILGCCCIILDEFGGLSFPQSGRPQKPHKKRKKRENPFLQFTPPTPPEAPQGAVTQVTTVPSSDRDILPESAPVWEPVHEAALEPEASAIAVPVLDVALELQREEEMFLALLLASEADDDCCCYQAHCGATESGTACC